MATNSGAEHKWYSFNILAVLAGAVVDIVSSNITTGCYGVIVAFMSMKTLMDQGLSPVQAQAQLVAQLSSMSTSPIVKILGLLCSVLGGYVAGRLAKYHEIKHALATIAVIIGFSLLLRLFFKAPETDIALWLIVSLYLLEVGADVLGGYLALLQRTPQQPQERTATT